MDNRKQSLPGFVPLLCFLPELYGSYQRPRPWSNPDREPDVRETFLHSGLAKEWWEYVHESFEKSNRAELYILPCASRTRVHVEIVFFLGSQDIQRKIGITYDLAENEISEEFQFFGGPPTRFGKSDL